MPLEPAYGYPRNDEGIDEIERAAARAVPLAFEAYDPAVIRI